ncbi:2Fe-2S iron-sulfur cluster binding protein domain protein [Sporothrix brasiliensis 5110]|uniref:2Fe-2S iron-sulfur cluster binding protein domain protein n=1 Tax=Sporothrix brasiliensis 5110 TaxID=1398154 RepID=A0A0C2ITH0_9PEZI|nr:2Fe-2S iron-sulfur cluster binding protein domain protein [Sporothrix brasiliensis 5110]KIH92381.1 2Fe-2S iron-sulfur cluster binding protein domain protein [Sporothrix brasiliensis 5110]
MTRARLVSHGVARFASGPCAFSSRTAPALRQFSSTARPAPRSPARTLAAFASLCASPLRQSSVQCSARPFSSSAVRAHGHIHKPKEGEELYVTFIDKDGDEHKLAVAAGDNLLDIAQAHDLEMEGACGGSCACSTCHVIVEDEAYFDKMNEPDDDENDMLDLAFGLTETSRLGCQVVMTKDLDGLVVRLPSMTRNLQASDFQAKSASG